MMEGHSFFLKIKIIKTMKNVIEVYPKNVCISEKEKLIRTDSSPETVQTERQYAQRNASKCLKEKKISSKFYTQRNYQK